LLAGDKDSEIESAVICLDINEKAYEMCVSSGSKLCISHHPFLFEPTKRLDYSDPYYNLLRKFIKADIAIYAAHTNLDSCVGGVNDALSAKLELTDLSTFMPSAMPFDFQKGIVPGIGRVGTPGGKASLFAFYHMLVKNLGVLGGSFNFDTDRPITKVLVIGGSYDSEWNIDVVDNEIDVVVCGEIKHKDFMFFDRYNIAAIAAGHDATERVILPVLADYLNLQLPQIKFAVCDNFDYNRVVF
jgi:dinuclear metal center YbgI/SA1388 family protein